MCFLLKHIGSNNNNTTSNVDDNYATNVVSIDPKYTTTTAASLVKIRCLTRKDDDVLRVGHDALGNQWDKSVTNI